MGNTSGHRSGRLVGDDDASFLFSFTSKLLNLNGVVAGLRGKTFENWSTRFLVVSPSSGSDSIIKVTSLGIVSSDEVELLLELGVDGTKYLGTLGP